MLWTSEQVEPPPELRRILKTALMLIPQVWRPKAHRVEFLGSWLCPRLLVLQAATGD